MTPMAGNLPLHEIETLRNPQMYSDEQIRDACRVAHLMALYRARVLGYRRLRDSRFTLLEEPNG